MLLIDSDWVASVQADRYRRRPELRVNTVDEATRFVDEVGFAFFWPVKGAEAPNLFEAIAGRMRVVPKAHDDPDLSKSWSWKDGSLGSTRWYYAKLLRKRATMVAPRLQPVFYALTKNYGDLDDYLELVRDGVMTHEARLIYEAMLEYGPLNTVELRRRAALSSSESKARFERALVELQIDMKALPIGVAEAGAWRYSFVYDIPMRHYPDLVPQARKISTREAWQMVISEYVDSTVAVTRKQIGQIFHIFEPTPRELDRAIESLAEAGRLVPATVEGTGEVWVSGKALEPAD